MPFPARESQTPINHESLIMFTVTSKRYTDSGQEVSRDEAERWLGGGWEGLPGAVAEEPFTPPYRVNALIYEFD